MNEEADRPSLFELIAQEQLRELLGPVLRYVTSVFAQSYPRYLLKILNYFDEINALLMFYIERYYLQNWGGSFSENFYGLTRRRCLVSKPIPLPTYSSRLNDNSGRMSKRHIRFSLFFLVAIPYLRSKAAALYEDLGGSTTSDLLDDELEVELRPSNSQDLQPVNLKERLVKLFKLIYPYTIVSIEFTHLIFSLGYLFGKTQHWRASQALTGIKIQRLGSQDLNEIQNKLKDQKVLPFTRDPITGIRPGWWLISKRLWRIISQEFFESIKVILPGSIFMFKFLEWWYSSSNTSRYRSLISDAQGNQFKPIQPPVPLKPQIKGVLGDGKSLLKPILKGHCPICRSKLVNATAIPSGWVFCYKCLHGYVVQFQRCPVTLFPTTLSDFRKIIG